MVYITSEDGAVKKFACMTCIKGHRSSGCKHSDRKLFEIKRKGRPVSQCAECRELRKTKQVHIKCICPSKKSEGIDLSSLIQQQQQQSTSKQASSNTSSTNKETKPVGSCSHCDRPKLLCICARQNHVHGPDVDYLSSSSSDGTVTPPYMHSPIAERTDRIIEHVAAEKSCALRLVIPSSKLGAAEYPTPENDILSSSSSSSPCPTTAHSAGLTVARTPPIPIHDPTDDLDSDTPIYKSEEHIITDRAAVLGELSNTTSEELMNQIYSGFIGNNNKADKKTGCNCSNPSTTTTTTTTACSNNPTCAIAKSRQDHHHHSSPETNQGGTLLGGSACEKALNSCSDCFQDMCEEYLLGHPHP